MEEQRGKNWLATMLACWFLGPLGMHRFYTGKKGSAIAMLIMTILVCTLPISAIWAWVDGITIALGKFRHADGSELYERIPWVGIVYIILLALGILCCLMNFAVLGAMLASFAGAGAGTGVGTGGF